MPEDIKTAKKKKSKVAATSYKKDLKPAFLEAYRKTGTQVAACQLVSVGWHVVDGWRSQDAEFAKELLALDRQSTQRIETSALNRAANGNIHFLKDRNGEPIYLKKEIINPKTGKHEFIIATDENGKPMQAISFREYDTTLQIFMLKSRDPKYREVIKQEIDLKIISRMTTEVVSTIRRAVPLCCPNCKSVLGINEKIAEEMKQMYDRFCDHK